MPVYGIIGARAVVRVSGVAIPFSVGEGGGGGGCRGHRLPTNIILFMPMSQCLHILSYNKPGARG